MMGLSLPLSMCLAISHGLLHGIRAGSFDNDGSFPPVVEHVFGH
jgi:hypothetical protein